MSTNTQAQASLQPKAMQLNSRTGPAPGLILLAAWLIPGAGHILLRKWIRGTLLLVSIVAMYLIGMGLQGKVYQPNLSDLLDMLGFIGDLGAGLLYILTRVFDLGHGSVTIAIADYGTKFIVAAGLLNLIAAVDAHSLASGRKQA